MSKENDPPSGEKPKRRIVGKPFAKGTSGNLSGRPKSFVNLTGRCRALTDPLIDAALEMALNKKTPANARCRAIEIILAYGHGRPATMLAVGSLGSLGSMGSIEGDGTDGLSALLLAARREHARELPSPAPSVTAASPEREPIKLDDIATSPKYSPPPSVEKLERDTAPPAPSISLDQAAIAENIGDTIAPEDPTPTQAEEATPSPPPKPVGSGMPSGFAEFSARREALRAQLPGGQAHAKDWFLPDREAQGNMEVVRFTRVAGTHGIRRVREGEK
jgi:hypothetical protein